MPVLGLAFFKGIDWLVLVELVVFVEEVVVEGAENSVALSEVQVVVGGVDVRDQSEVGIHQAIIVAVLVGVDRHV